MVGQRSGKGPTGIKLATLLPKSALLKCKLLNFVALLVQVLSLAVSRMTFKRGVAPAAGWACPKANTLLAAT